MWDIVDYTDEYFDEMIEMTIEYYGKDNDISNGDFIRHEYFNNPAGDAFVKIAYDNDNHTMAGQYIVIPRDYFIHGQTYKSVLSLNTLTRDTYRGQQVFTKLAEAVYGSCKDHEVSFCYGAPNPNSFPGFVKKLSFKNMGEIPLYLKIINPFRLLCDKAHISYSHDDKKVNLNAVNITGKYRIVKITTDNIDLFNPFWKKINKKYEVVGVRDAQYIKWRYIDLPRREYNIYMALKENEPCGYIIGREAEVAGIRCGMLVDFLFEKGKYDVGDLLLNTVISEFKMNKIGLVGSLMQMHTEEAELLKRKRFFICPKKMLPQPFPIVYRQFKELPVESEQIATNFKNWFITMGDYDVI